MNERNVQISILFVFLWGNCEENQTNKMPHQPTGIKWISAAMIYSMHLTVPDAHLVTVKQNVNSFPSESHITVPESAWGHRLRYHQ